MTTWESLVVHIHANFDVACEYPDGIRLDFARNPRPADRVFIWKQAMTDGDWIQVDSPIGEVSRLDLPSLILRVGIFPCGGLGAIDDSVTYRQALPLDGLSIDKFERLIRIVRTGVANLR